MPFAYIFEFAHQDLNAARKAIESALAIQLEETPESDGMGNYFRVDLPAGPTVQLRCNFGPFQRWVGEERTPWYPAYGILVWVHGQSPESILPCLQNSVPGLTFLELRPPMC